MFSPKTAIFFFLFFAAAVVQAQDTTVDSLRAGIQRSKTDEARLKSYVLLAGKLSQA